MQSPMIGAGVVVLLLTGILGASLATQPSGQGSPASTQPSSASLANLPPPQVSGGMSLGETLARRRSVRAFTGKPLTVEQVAQLCWSAQGITDTQRGRRTAPSAGATYPLKLLAALPEGLYEYVPAGHSLKRISDRDVRTRIAEIARQRWIASAGAVFVLTGDMSITTARYRERGEEYVWQETGHAAQNLLLQAVALDLASTPVGAYDEGALNQLLQLPKGWRTLYVLPVGVAR